jgi:putative copper export protein
VAGTCAVVVTPFLRVPRGAVGPGVWAGDVLAGLGGTSWGRLWVLHGVCFAAAAMALVLATGRVRPGGWQRPVAAVAVVGATVADAAAGHAAGLPRDVSPAVVATSLHAVGAGVWAGSLLVLTVCLLPAMRRDPAVRRPLLFTTWRAFSPIAAAASVVVLASGLYLVGRELPDLRAVTTTVYGAATAGKLLAVVLVLGTASMTTLLVNPALAHRAGRVVGRPVDRPLVGAGRFGRLVVVELGILLLAVGLAALMGSVPTARESAVVAAVSAPRAATVDGLFLTFEEVPAGVGDSRIIVRVNPVTRPQPGPVTGSDVLLVGPDQQSVSVLLRPIEAGRFEGAAPSLASGAWTAWVAVQRPGVPDAIAEVAWTVSPEDAGAVTALERLTTILALLLIAGPAVVVLVLRRHRRRRAPVSTVPPGPGPSTDAPAPADVRARP